MTDRSLINHGVLIPGNGCGKNLNGCMWYPWLANKLTSCRPVALNDSSSASNSTDTDAKESPAPPSTTTSTDRIQMQLKGFPNHLEAYEHVWKPFAIDVLGLNEHSILVGHSSGAACSLRLMEERPIAACVLVAAYDDDLGDETEAESGYFNRPFNYDKMVENCPIIFQFHSKNDHLVPVAIARRVAAGLRKASEEYNNRLKESQQQQQPLPNLRPHTFVYIETTDDGHFQDDEYEEIMWEPLTKVIPFQK